MSEQRPGPPPMPGAPAAYAPPQALGDQRRLPALGEDSQLAGHRHPAVMTRRVRQQR